MGSAILNGALNKGILGAQDILALDKVQERTSKLKDSGINIAKGIEELVEGSKTIFLCVKPQDSKEVLDTLSKCELGKRLIVSIMAGVSIGTMRRLLGLEVSIVRAMPNTPLLVGEGVTAISYNGHRREEHLPLVKAIFGSLGLVFEVDETLMDPITALSGSGPGFVFKLMEVFWEAGRELGIPEGMAKEMVIQTFLGAARLSKESQMELPQLREMVTSKGGTTEAGLKRFSELNLDRSLKETLKAASSRASAINEELSLKLTQ